MDDYPLNAQPGDLVDERLKARLVRHVQDLPTGSPLVLVLIDTVFHYLPSVPPQTVRKPMYSIPWITASQVLNAMFLGRYCRYTEQYCFVFLNHRLWHQDTAEVRTLANGDYIRIEIPPPNQEHSTLDTRCVAVAHHQRISFEILHLFDALPPDQMLMVPNPYQVMIEQDLIEADGDSMQLLQLAVQVWKGIQVASDMNGTGVKRPRHPDQQHRCQDRLAYTECGRYRVVFQAQDSDASQPQFQGGTLEMHTIVSLVHASTDVAQSSVCATREAHNPNTARPSEVIRPTSSSSFIQGSSGFCSDPVFLPYLQLQRLGDPHQNPRSSGPLEQLIQLD